MGRPDRIASAMAMPNGSPLQVRLAVDVGQPHQRRHVVAFAEQRNPLPRARAAAPRAPMRPPSVALLGAGLRRPGNPDAHAAGPVAELRGGFQQHLVAFPPLEPRRHQHDDVVVARRRAPGAAPRAGRDRSAGGRRPGNESPGRAPTGNAGRASVNSLLNTARSGRTNRAQRSGHVGPGNRLMLPENDARPAGARRRGEHRVRPGAVEHDDAGAELLLQCGERAPRAPHHQRPRGARRRQAVHRARLPTRSSRSSRPPNETTNSCRSAGCGVVPSVTSIRSMPP